MGNSWKEEKEQLIRIIDTHSHILPEVDDGAQNIEEAGRRRQIAYDEGIRYIIATPHHHPRRGSQPPRALRRQLKLVREEAKKISEKLRVYLGTEIYFGQDVMDKLKEKKVLPMNGTRYVLVEFAPGDSADYINQSLQRIQMKGYIVILAHIERYKCLRESMSDTRHLANMGVKIQVNAGSITGASGWRVKQYIKQLMKEDLVFCVGTDAHNAQKRPPQIKKAAEYVKKKYGEEYMRRIFFSNAVVMLKKKKKNESRQTNTGI